MRSLRQCRRAETVEKGHGRIETRKIAVSREVVPYPAWPGLAQVARIERRREIARKTSTEIVYLITSLPPEPASRSACCASPGTIGASRTGSTTSATSPSPRIDAASAPAPPPASLRNLAITLIRRAGLSISEARENFREDRANAITFVTGRVL